MDLRELKGLEIAARTKIVFADGIWLVPSQTTATKYKITLDGRESCECDDFTLRQLPCKHIHAARLVRERDHGGKSPIVVADSPPKKPAYKQDWPAYNLAQTTEKRRLQVLLAELCRNVPQMPNAERGPRRIPTADVVFAMVFKVYTCMPTRRFACDLEDAQTKGHVSQVAHFNSIIRHFDNPEMTPILRDLVIRASLPLKAVEVDFAADSSGFSTNRFVKWYDEKYGVTRSGHDWVKVHVMTGVKTNVVTAVEIRGRDAGDSPLLPELLKTTAENFAVREVSADKGYSSVENTEAVFQAGGTPFIAYKANTTGAGRRPVGEDVPLLPVPPGRVPRPLPQAEQRRIDVQHGQGEVPGSRPGEDRRGDDERSPVQVHLPQHLLRDSGALRARNRSRVLAG